MSSNSDAMLGAIRAAVRRPDFSSCFTWLRESLNSMALGEHAMKHSPHPMHLSAIITGCALSGFTSIALTGHTLTHEYELRHFSSLIYIT